MDDQKLIISDLEQLYIALRIVGLRAYSFTCTFDHIASHWTIEVDEYDTYALDQARRALKSA